MKHKKTIIVILFSLILIFSSSIGLARVYFYDIYGHWAEDSIMWGANTVKLLNGYEDGSFNPDGYISRAEYISLLYRTAKKQGIIDDVRTDLEYSDLDYSFWGYDHISMVKSYIDNKSYDVKFNSIFSGKSFYPNDKITREEATILTYFFTLPPVALKDLNFNDIDNNYKYFNEIKSITNNGIISGYPDGAFRPKNNITRGEAVTIIKRLFSEVEYQKKSYIEDIKLIESSDKVNYPLFGDYFNTQLSKDDLLYKRAIETMEYVSLAGVIPFEERHLYDTNPMKTMEELKNNNYSNIIGTNYYLIKNGSRAYNDKVKLANEIFQAYINGAQVTNSEASIIFKEFSGLVESNELIIEALELWENTSSSEEVYNNAVFMRSKVYLAEGQGKDAMELYKDMNSLRPNIRTIQLMNQGYVLASYNEYDIAENILREGWEQVKKLDGYIINQKNYDEQFIGALKEILSLKENTL
ncbi:S-layer homology domain-containing protein [Proteiniborus ethanoligenes]|uniref:S-layer homology domain-containing protein n=1 Tax=Proteiniborus ethanoligenes TaxID=415015 RepID=A0A1H3Q134_9FIRM|nr:S-layer homology domain-containing protein [Proteiniborus ethanoligenes]TAH62922.1 MAG: S-layer homology domain-containing protein [Gottschalkiaceae bacterium]SDZ07046.1 S-layer homology domain-containing protein [Proteiniborus ethanoligenes]